MDTIAFPLRFSANHLATLETGSEEYFNQLISVAIQTAPGEYALDIDFGIKDMTFTDMTSSSIKQTLSFYFPELFVDNVKVVQDVKTSNYLVDVFYNY
jgi:hypothetical protein